MGKAAGALIRESCLGIGRDASTESIAWCMKCLKLLSPSFLVDITMRNNDKRRRVDCQWKFDAETATTILIFLDFA